MKNTRKTLTALLGLICLIGTTGLARATGTLLYDSNTGNDFAATRSAVSAGSTLVNGLTDAHGGVWTTGGGLLTGTPSAEGNYYSLDYLIRPVSENARDAKVVLTIPAGVITTGNWPMSVMRCNPANNIAYQPFLLAGNDQLLKNDAPGYAGGSNIVGTGVAWTFNSSHVYQFVSQVVGVNPQVVTESVYDMTSPAGGQPVDPIDPGLTGALMTFTYSETQPFLSGPGRMGVCLYSAMSYSRVRTYSLDNSQSILTNSNIYWSPDWIYDTTKTPAEKRTEYAGQQFRIALTGTSSITIGLDTLGLAPGGTMSTLAYSLDGGPWQSVKLSQAVVYGVGIASGLSTGTTHYLVGYLQNTNIPSDLWNSPGAFLAVNSIGIDSGGSAVSLASSPYAPLSSYAWFFGDSYTAGYSMTGNGSTDSGFSNAYPGFTFPVAAALGCEPNILGIPGQFFAQTSGGISVPGFTSAWNKKDANTTRPISAGVKYVFVNEGTNPVSNLNPTVGAGTAATFSPRVAGDASNNMVNLRAGFGASTYIIYIVPFDGAAKSTLLNDLSYYGGGTTATNGYTTLSDGPSTVYAAVSDPRTWVIDLGIAPGVNSSAGAGTPSANSYDGTHPNVQWDSIEAARIIHAVQTKASPQASGKGSRPTSKGGH